MTDPLGLIGTRLGEYEFLEFRGNGAFGFVYAGISVTTGDKLAFKVLKPGAPVQSAIEFANERTLLVKANSATRVVDIFDTRSQVVPVTFAGGGTMNLPIEFHVLELAELALADYLVGISQVPWLARLRLFRDVVLGVHQLHCKSIMHRDLKAENILLFDGGDRVIAKLNDLGRSRDITSSPTPGADYEFGRGDPSFAPPEFICGLGVDAAASHIGSDLYGLGSVLFELTFAQGLSGLAMSPHGAAIMTIRAIPVGPTRQSAYLARAAEMRSWFCPLYESFERDVPAAIRHPASQLLRQLTDPDPEIRFPRVAPGRRGQPAEHLTWLLRRVDILIKILANAEKQRAHLERKKEARK